MPNDPDPHPSPGPPVIQSQPTTSRDSNQPPNPRGYGRHRPNRGSRPPAEQRPPQQPNAGSSSPGHAPVAPRAAARRPRGPPRAQPSHRESQESPNQSAGPLNGPPAHRSRRRQFGSKLTESEPAQGEAPLATTSSHSNRLPTRGPVLNKEHLDLTHRLIASFARSASNTDDAPDCPICFNTISPGAPTWSCSPHNNILSGDAVHESSGGITCWTPFHLKCIKEWAFKSVKETGDAFVARGVHDRVGEWRCPGCQTRRSVVPSEYRCFCGRTVDPRPGRLATPHSCGDACSRKRTTCVHPCALQCHPGPCPPCILTVTQQCHCGKQTISLRCSSLASSSAAPLSCNQPCDRPLSCGNHRCEQTCHPGPCEECPIVVSNKCYCGRETRLMRCGEGEPEECELEGVGKWEGRWACPQTCDRPFDCGAHRCQQSCHSPSPKPAHCPRSPDMITTCPCSHLIPLSSLSAPTRRSCSDPIPTCPNICAKPLPDCAHLCREPCHEDSCAPCSVKVEERCRCGRAGRQRKCYETTTVPLTSAEEEEDVYGVFMCDRKCTAMRGCGRHMCGRICCPLAALAGIDSGAKGKGKKKELPTESEMKELDPDGWHLCDLICNKRLSCGNHNCTERDHRGPCPPCLQSSYQELVCHCRRTILDPPIPCGTVIHCAYPCTRPAPACGHPRAPHACHDDSETCPPCPYLADKPCACGKTVVKNVRCSMSSDKVGCGTKCGKSLDCGFHSCDKMCHAGECGTCHQTCGKARKSCLPAIHPCPLPCHAPTACPETAPCPAPVTLRCACGRLSQPSVCGNSSTAGGAGSTKQRVLPCMSECAIAKRNEKLAAALGISADRHGQGGGVAAQEVKYGDGVISFVKANAAFAATAEKNLNEFITSDKRMIILPPMPLPRRQFVRSLAEAYRLDGEDVDQEPRRSVQLRRRIDSRIPNPLLSVVIGAARLAPTTGSSSAAPVRMAWGQRPTAAPTTAAAAIASRPNPANLSAWSAVTTKSPALNAAAMASSSRPQTPQANLSKPASPALLPVPHVTGVSQTTGDVPDDWAEAAE